MFEHTSKFVSVQDKTTQDSTAQDIPIKSSPRKRRGRFRLTAPVIRTRSGIATHKQLVKIAHEVFMAHPKETEQANLVDLMKTGCARWGLSWREPREITKALDSAAFQRRRRRES